MGHAQPSPNEAPVAPSETPVPSAADLEAARVHFMNGVTLANEQRNFSAALAEFQASYKLGHNAAVLYNIGVALQELHQYPEAIDALTHFLEESTNAPPDQTASASAIINDLKLLLSDVTLTISPAGAAVVVDGRAVGKAPLAKPVQLAAGMHVIEVSSDGFEPQKKSLTTAAQINASLAIALDLIPKTGKVRISASVPRATVAIDGKAVGLAPLEVELGGGGHQVEVNAPHYKTNRSELVIAVGQVREVTITLEKPVVVKDDSHWYRKWYVWAPIGVLAVGGGIGIYELSSSSSSSPVEGTLQPGIGTIH
jgi:hypothetical protein